MAPVFIKDFVAECERLGIRYSPQTTWQQERERRHQAALAHYQEFKRRYELKKKKKSLTQSSK
jgi:hypothetical protein